MTVSPIPEGYMSITPYLIVSGAARAIDFYRHVFGASEVMRMDRPDGRVGHAEMIVGNSRLMLADEVPDIGAHSPQTLGGSPVSLLLYVPDVNATVDRAVGAGAEITRPLKDQFYGDRTASLRDPFGHLWTVATHIEDVAPAEMQRRAAAAGSS